LWIVAIAVSRIVKYANEAVLPFYIMHQTVIILIGYYVRDWLLAVLPKYLLLAASSFMIIVVYEWIYNASFKKLTIPWLFHAMSKQPPLYCHTCIGSMENQKPDIGCMPVLVLQLA
jgi:hypothetical protein